MISNYRSDIDTLRAISVLSVVLHHANISGFSGGFVGVDVFFVISGYLITTILIREVSEDRFSLLNFYERRARRLLPALFLVLFVTTVIAYCVLFPKDFDNFGKSLFYVVLFGSNVHFWWTSPDTASGYFAPTLEVNPLLHTWSLGVEEQYYLLFPVMLLLCYRFSKGLFIYIALALFAMSLFASEWSVRFGNDFGNAAFYLLQYRFWELLIGALLAWLVINHHHLFSSMSFSVALALRLLGILLIVLSLTTYSPKMAFPGVSALLPCVGAVSIIAAGSGSQNPLGRLFGLRPVVTVGLISYSLYLWHWPILVYLELVLVRPLQGIELPAYVAVSILVAWVSWRFIERPFRRSEQTSSKQIVLYAIACGVTCMAVGIFIAKSGGLPDRVPAAAKQAYSAAKEKNPNRRFVDCDLLFRSTEEPLCRIGVATKSPTFAVFGDSHSAGVGLVIERYAEEKQLAGVIASAPYCASILGWAEGAPQCKGYVSRILEYLEEHDEIRDVILTSRWSLVTEGSRFGYESDFYVGEYSDDTTSSRDLGRTEFFRYALRNLIDKIERNGQRVILVSGVPEHARDVPLATSSQLWHGWPEASLTLKQHRERQREAELVIANVEELGTLVYHPAQAMCDTETCLSVYDNKPLYMDEDHLSMNAPDFLIEDVENFFTSIGGLGDVRETIRSKNLQN